MPTYVSVIDFPITYEVIRDQNDDLVLTSKQNKIVVMSCLYGYITEAVSILGRLENSKSACNLQLELDSFA